jgi:hypothetical protein
MVTLYEVTVQFLQAGLFLMGGYAGIVWVRLVSGA